MDKIILRRMPFKLSIGKDAWGREKPQPVFITLEARFDVRNAAAADDVSKTLDYGKAYKALKEKLDVPTVSIGDVIRAAADSVEPGEMSLIEVVLPKGSLRAEGGVQFYHEIVNVQSLSYPKRYKQLLSIRGIRCACIIGVNPHEREEEQIVIVNLDFSEGDFDVLDPADFDGTLDRLEEEFFSIPYADVVRAVVKVRVVLREEHPLQHQQWTSVSLFADHG